ncbi:hypothetical protein NPIL_466661, partial [Nephila pilipes]
GQVTLVDAVDSRVDTDNIVLTADDVAVWLIGEEEKKQRISDRLRDNRECDLNRKGRK